MTHPNDNTVKPVVLYRWGLLPHVTEVSEFGVILPDCSEEQRKECETKRQCQWFNPVHEKESNFEVCRRLKLTIQNA